MHNNNLIFSTNDFNTIFIHNLSKGGSINNFE